MSGPTVKAKIFKIENRTAEQQQFASFVEALSFASDLLNKTSSASNPVFCELQSPKMTMVMQCQDPSYFLQVFRNELAEEGWLTVVEKKNELDLETEIVIPCYEDNEDISATHFRLIGIEGAWVSKALLCKRDLIIRGLTDLNRFTSGQPWNEEDYWIDVGLM